MTEVIKADEQIPHNPAAFSPKEWQAVTVEGAKKRKIERLKERPWLFLITRVALRCVK